MHIHRILYRYVFGLITDDGAKKFGCNQRNTINADVYFINYLPAFT